MIVRHEAGSDSEVPHAVARELWAHDMKSPFTTGEYVSAGVVRLLEQRARREASGS
ncbi:hypothetical protein [Kitasatospora sp. NPDC059673]|uniref:hypothetical protein n=1 Tax=Kitasatospora sp. NPDC059673 TaxID=3346901 RepID=UPI0036B82295